ncbi:PDZ domain-containing protein [Lactiplantibacillus carotarum]|uniref:PDZ domain-containing protein n=1 Tax=Lactiplantibacillus carotarum TaxID=2993456 RepID=UPI00298ED378|nr:PDZ domain-containing protein [Lactiplantibacillus carotarum]
MQVLKVLELFFLQPLVWLGLLRSYLTARQRVNYERHHFRSAINARYVEVRHFVLDGILFGIATSIISLALGLVVAPVWVVIYELLAVISLVAIPFALVPVTVFGLSWLIYWSFSPQLTTVGGALQRYGVTTTSMSGGLLINGLVLLALMLAGTALLLRRHAQQGNSPQLRPDQRGKRIVRYRWQQLLVLPVAVLVPGDWLHATFSWWPVFMVGQRSFSILLLPLLVGASVQVYKQLPQVAWRLLAKHYGSVAVIALGLAIIARFAALSPQWLLLLIGIVVVLTWGILAQHRYHDRHQQFRFSDTDQGVRVIGIRPQTPAAKLNLGLGDVILECNRQPVHTEAQFYAALLTSPTYVHLKVRNLQQELIITETAIYDGAPHELGIVLFTDQED